ncbi:hypothetical protein [Frigoriflavimonas asaccharolytica]|uniref:Putative membrane protein n=1 Tax=Frigoriflavimonas asaccharolytica TaxID=2735899 RepID=A0A8J8K3S7_9FLAO|nr:hypothetical protein [Frigoriflavimonas asaccharolytica]NRS90960.1 putative membrane protein [Frigoriflavimonas asaccharolytica]
MNDLNQNQNVNQPQDNEDLETIMKVLSFCIPLAGAILWYINKDKAPKKSKAACHMALYGLALGVVLQILATVMGIGAASLSN